MLLGRPVIATGWSGNMAFMDERSAALVGYRLVPAEDPRHVYEGARWGAVWAEPDQLDAVAHLRRLADDAVARAALGARAERQPWRGWAPARYRRPCARWASPRRPSPHRTSPHPISPRPISPRPISPRPISPRPISPRPISPQRTDRHEGSGLAMGPFRRRAAARGAAGRGHCGRARHRGDAVAVPWRRDVARRCCPALRPAGGDLRRSPRLPDARCRRAFLGARAGAPRCGAFRPDLAVCALPGRSTC